MSKQGERVETIERYLNYDSGDDIDEELMILIRIRLIHLSQQGLVARASGDSDTGNKLILEALRRWQEVRSRFEGDSQLESEMEDLALLVSDLSA